MSFIIKQYALIIFIVCFAGIGLVAAQDENPVSDDLYLIYYEDEIPNQLDITLLKENVCLEAVLQLNPDLDMNHIDYGTPIWIPKNQPCYNYDQSEDGWWNFSAGKPPRLKYYEQGQWLDEPYYSENVVYVGTHSYGSYISPESLEDISHRYNICLDDLLADNYLLNHFDEYREYPDFSMDIFIPQDAEPCYPPEQLLPSVTAKFRLETTADKLYPKYFADTLNICVEEIKNLNEVFYPFGNTGREISVIIPTDAPPCYNEAGQRLAYYDDMGNPLEQAVYSDLPVYTARSGETLDLIAQQTGICLIDLLRVNHFPDMPVNGYMEIFLPPVRPCPDNVEAVSLVIDYGTLKEVALSLDICQDELTILNPHLSNSTPFDQTFFYNQRRQAHWAIIPHNAKPCYQQYEKQDNESIYDIEQQLNVCYQDFIYQSDIITDKTIIYYRIDLDPCYNELGQRKYYPPRKKKTFREYEAPEAPYYTDMMIHSIRPSDTVYSISQQYNVCVEDLIAVNDSFRLSFRKNTPMFIPHTPPCYDTVTGLQIEYNEHEKSIQLRPELIHFGSQPFGQLSYFYDVCYNRIRDANQAKLDHEASYLGWIIPTDRPPCYDDMGQPIDYVCYNQPIDFSVDYRQPNEKISFDIDGTNCYDLKKDDTLVWYEDLPYQVIYYWETMLENRAFTAWCYGVSLDEINIINGNPDVLEMLPYRARLIPKATCDCYIDHPDMLEGKTVHTVAYGETLSSIAHQYDKLPAWIAAANDLNDQNVIWAGQKLTIPDGLKVSDLYLLLVGLCGVGAFFGLIYLRLFRAYPHKKKRKIQDSP